MNEFIDCMSALNYLDCGEENVPVTGGSEDTHFYHTLSPSSVQSVNMPIKFT